MRIGVDTACWINARGYGRFTREILRAMIENHGSHEYVFITDSATYPQCSFPDGVQVINVPVKNAAANAASYSSYRSAFDIYQMSSWVAKMNVDVIFFPSVYTYFPVFSKAKKMVTIHDTIPETHPEMVFQNLRAKMFWKLKTAVALRQADMVLTVSEHSREQIASHFKIDEQQIAVTSEAADVFFEPKSNGLTHNITKQYGLAEGDRYFLYVGGVGPHKNIKTLIHAYRELQKRLNAGEQKLVIVGDFEADSFLMDVEIRDFAHANNPQSGILFTGYVPDEHLPYLYSRAEACILPSFSEGFGLPALEAMACGTMVIGSRTTSLPEIVCDAGLFFDPRNYRELAACMERVYVEPALGKTLGELAQKRAKTYTWGNAARTVIETMEIMVA